MLFWVQCFHNLVSPLSLFYFVCSAEAAHMGRFRTFCLDFLFSAGRTGPVHPAGPPPRSTRMSTKRQPRKALRRKAFRGFVLPEKAGFRAGLVPGVYQAHSSETCKPLCPKAFRAGSSCHVRGDNAPLIENYFRLFSVVSNQNCAFLKLIAQLGKIYKEDPNV